jgi:UDP-2-acetamido-2-deoxy-ribo-hexuluronate aminotransferase
MDFIDLAAQQRRIADKLIANMTRVLAHSQYINGPEVRELEQTLADYVGLLSGIVATPQIPEGNRSAWAQYSIVARDGAERAVLMARLKVAGIPTAVYYPKPLHRQKAFASLGYREGDFPVSEDCARRIFSLPMHPYLAAADRRRIADVLRGK